MSGKYQAYPEYMDSGIEWLESIPSHWDMKKLKFIANVQPSNVDKKTKDGETEVVLCNYTDVYYNDTVYSEMDFMKASATEEQIDKFTLQAGDTIITKDSEDPNDIAVPTFVPEDMPGVVCGYHLSIIRPNEKSYGSYVKRVFECSYARSFFATRSNGLTRYGLGTYALDNVFYPKPPKVEAEKIANFLDHETAKIDTLIEKQQQLIKLLKEKRQGVISHAVSKGLNSNAPMRDSGVEWLGEVPEHWDVNNINYILNAIGDVDHYMPQSVEKGIPYVMTGDLKELASSINFEDCKQVSHKDYLKLSKKIKSSRGDVIMARYATIGTASYIDIDADFLVSYSCVTIKPNLSKVFGLYLFYYFKSDAFLQGIQNQINTNTQGNVGVNDLKKVKVALPTLAEQSRIIEYLQPKIRKLNSISDRSQATIDLMKERRTALISAAVTGKIDVRNWVAPAHPCTRDISASMHVTTPELSNNKVSNKEAAV